MPPVYERRGARDRGNKEDTQERLCDKLLAWNEFAANAMRCWPRLRKRTGAPPVEARLSNGLNWLTIRSVQCPSKWIIAVLCCRGGTRWAG